MLVVTPSGKLKREVRTCVMLRPLAVAESLLANVFVYKHGEHEFIMLVVKKGEKEFKVEKMDGEERWMVLVRPEGLPVINDCWYQSDYIFGEPVEIRMARDVPAAFIHKVGDPERILFLERVNKSTCQ